MENLKYPIGKFNVPASYTTKQREEFIKVLKDAPFKFKEAITSLNEEQLNTPYREGGWTPKQVINHVADSHMNSLIRVKLALTEENPTIKGYDENAWITLSDSNCDFQSSLKIIEGIHERYVILLESLTDEQFKRTCFHPELNQKISIDFLLALYAWHSQHHLAHIYLVKNNK
ncbi:YfiT family bacillithiol transferase [Bacillus sp. AFS017336]|uniref:YfiT family bacillithiol transferase n=1 Tax=Bacillus sp. AFS017336 TaxID=2033489 RepID=UPI000BEFCB2C|nr:putative metal-dependent hydrolase [Bacillus sp. AFS017336]PEL14413.1 metal-dependent hydrolase [Bacillus sp. AFS017336]